MMTQSVSMQQKMLCVTLESLMPKQHFLRDLDRLIDFCFIYEKAKPLYSQPGRPSFDPVIIIKMLLLGYLYGINSDRQLELETQVNIAFRWFLGINLDERVPDHSTFSQLRRRKFNNSPIFEEIFTDIVKQCIDLGLVEGKLLLTDSTHVRANVRNDVFEHITVEVEPTAYLQRINEQFKTDGVYTKEHSSVKQKSYKSVIKSPIDADCGFMKKKSKPLGFYYLSHQTCDSKYGIITDVFVTSGNTHDAIVHSARIKYQIEKYGFKPEAICADAGYDSSEIHKDMLDLGIKTYIPKSNLRMAPKEMFCNNDFIYNQETDTLICPVGKTLVFTTYKPKYGNKRYSAANADCSNCLLRKQCISGKGKHKDVERPYYKHYSDIQHLNNNTPEYFAAMRLRKIWCEGNFAHQKAEHNLTKVRKRGLRQAFEHYLLSAMALNLKRLVRLIDASQTDLLHIPCICIKTKCNALKSVLNFFSAVILLFVNSSITLGPNFKTGTKNVFPNMPTARKKPSNYSTSCHFSKKPHLMFSKMLL